MRSTTRRAAGWLALALLLAAGCQRLNDERTVTVEGTGWNTLDSDPPRYEQKVTVTVSSPEAPLDVYLVKAADKEAMQEALDKDKDKPVALAKQEKAKETTLEATVPAKTGFTIFLVGTTGKTVQAKVKVVGH
jgi:hypothetical protein